MRISKSKVEKWTELVDEMSNQLYELEDSINKQKKNVKKLLIYNQIYIIQLILMMK